MFGLGGGFDINQIMNLLKKMGVKTEEIEADEVIIKGGKEIIIKNPKVLAIEYQGKKSFQIMGDVQEIGEDVKILMEKGNLTKDEAEKLLKECNGDLVEALSRLGIE